MCDVFNFNAHCALRVLLALSTAELLAANTKKRVHWAGLLFFFLLPYGAHPTCSNRLKLSPGRMGWSWNRQNHAERAAVNGPEKLSRAAHATEGRWGPFLPVPSWVRAPNRHAPCRAGNCQGLESPGPLPAGRSTPLSRSPKLGVSGGLQIAVIRYHR